jgi:putative oxidoreductase
MKILTLVARILLALTFLVFGADKIVPFIHAPMPTGDAGTLIGLMFAHKWILFYGLIESASGLMLLAGRFVPLALTLLAGMGTNILLFNLTLTPSNLPIPLFLAVLEIYLVYAYRANFAGIFTAKAEPA